MSIKILSHATALNPGHSLWTFPQIEHSKWAQKLDWYQNFAWTKSLGRGHKSLSEPLQKIITEEEVEVPEVCLTQNAPLMIASFRYFPNEQNLQLPFNPNEMEAWVDQLKIIWEQLLHPKMRVFLPQQLSPELFETIWSDPKTHTKLSLVTES